jgi:hypothetical protein
LTAPLDVIAEGISLVSRARPALEELGLVVHPSDMLLLTKR